MAHSFGNIVYAADWESMVAAGCLGLLSITGLEPRHHRSTGWLAKTVRVLLVTSCVASISTLVWLIWADNRLESVRRFGGAAPHPPIWIVLAPIVGGVVAAGVLVYVLKRKRRYIPMMVVLAMAFLCSVGMSAELLNVDARSTWLAVCTIVSGGLVALGGALYPIVWRRTLPPQPTARQSGYGTTGPRPGMGLGKVPGNPAGPHDEPDGADCG